MTKTVTPRFKQTTRANIRDLCVSYSQYTKAVADPHMSDRDIAISVWGGMLKETQEKLGIELLPPADMKLLIEFARERIDAKNREIAA